MPTSRQRIINYIQEKQSVTVDELSKVFKVTPANIRHHLSILLEQGNVKVIGELPSSSRGRPAQLYSTIHQIDQNNLDRLTDVLLAELLNNCPLEQRELLIKNIARRMCSSFKIDSKNPTHRLYTAIQFLNHNRYQAHWEAHFESPRIMFGHCPYKAILDQHPEMCQMDTYLLGDLLETPTKQVAKLAPTPRGLPQCIFLINISSLAH